MPAHRAVDRRLGPAWALAEVALFYALALLIIWGSAIWRPPVLLTGVVMLGICLLSNRFHGDSIDRIGLARRNFLPALRLLMIVSAPFLLVLIALAWGKPFPPGWGGAFAVLGYPVWGFIQEYALLGFVANRLEDVAPGRSSALALVNGALFSLAHLPNPVLMPITFVSGTLFTWVFYRRRHLVPPALVHAAAGILLSLITSRADGLMSVGPAYIRRMGQWF